MRISDWSSDVCSSDLVVAALLAALMLRRSRRSSRFARSATATPTAGTPPAPSAARHGGHRAHRRAPADAPWPALHSRVAPAAYCRRRDDGLRAIPAAGRVVRAERSRSPCTPHRTEGPRVGEEGVG